MNEDFFSGKWTGEYTYGADYPGMDNKPPVAFWMNITVTDGAITGECIDDETKAHFPRPAIVIGALRGHEISFEKKYPWFWDHDENNKPRFFPKIPARKVQYAGRFEDGKFSGEWIISSVYTDESGEVLEYRGTGTWYMEKIS